MNILKDFVRKKNAAPDDVKVVLRGATNVWFADTRSSISIPIQSNGQGPESLNLAACHNCALLPETCCENGNRLLDRAVVVGELTNYEIGYFSDLLNN